MTPDLQPGWEVDNEVFEIPVPLSALSQFWGLLRSPSRHIK